MGIIIIWVVIVLLIGPIATYHKHQEENLHGCMWILFAPLILCVVFGYLLFTGYVTADQPISYYSLWIAFLISIYSSIVSLIMFSHYGKK